MAQNTIPPVPPLTKEGFEDPVWARWLGLLRANLAAAVTSIQIATANGFSGTVSGSAPAILTLQVTVSGILKGNGAGAIVAATPGTDYIQQVLVTAPITDVGAPGSPNISHATSGVVAGTYTKVTVDVFGHVTAGTSLSGGDVTGALGYTPLNPANNLSDLANTVTARNNLGLGTIAVQNANNVAVTGGTINGTTVGVTTPAVGLFTTLFDSQMSSVRAATTNAQVVATGAFATVTNWTTTRNVGSNFVAATGVYTVPLTGEYDVRAAVRFAATGAGVTAQCIVSVFVNGVGRYQSGVSYVTAGATPLQASGAWLVSVTAGDLITVRVFQNTGANQTLDTTAVANWINIQQTNHV